MANEPPSISGHQWHRAGIRYCVYEGASWPALGDKCDCEPGNSAGADGPPSESASRCPRCGGPVASSAPDDWYCREVFCGWEDDHAPE